MGCTLCVCIYGQIKQNYLGAFGNIHSLLEGQMQWSSHAVYLLDISNTWG